MQKLKTTKIIYKKNSSRTLILMLHLMKLLDLIIYLPKKPHITNGGNILFVFYF